MMMHRIRSPRVKVVALAGSILALALGATLARAQAPAPNTLTAAEKAAGWKLLFDGKTLDGWRQYKGTTPSPVWQVVDGAIAKVRPAPDIVSMEQFADFELVFEWKLSVTGNAGVFYRATEEYDRIYWSATEFQLLDNAKGADNATALTRAGAAYGIKAAPDGHDKPSVYGRADSTVRAGRNGGPARVTWRAPNVDVSELPAFLKAGEWNQAKVIAKGTHVEHWLNGFKLVEFDVGAPDWVALVAASKFAPYPNYMRAKTGFVGIQGDHGGALALRNIKIRELK
jgi:hypothetical protein